MTIAELTRDRGGLGVYNEQPKTSHGPAITVVYACVLHAGGAIDS